MGGISFFAVTIEYCHALRAYTDGALFDAIGLSGGRAAVAMLLVNIGVGTALCFALTDDKELPTNFFDAAYWAIVTGTSVGYGDHFPTTDLGKIATCVYAFASMTVCSNAMDVAKDALLALCTAPKEKTS
jgi:voltage-gated potassium channel